VLRAIKAVPGVVSETVDLPKDDVIVHFDPHRTSQKAIGAAIERAGFHPHPSR
jgi:copper chaperone CopZ